MENNTLLEWREANLANIQSPFGAKDEDPLRVFRAHCCVY